MNILIVGSGGREHALCWKVAQSKACTGLYCAPGNSGTALWGTNLPVPVSDFDSLRKACLQHNIGLVIIGPEEPLCNGLVDFLKEDGGLNNLLIIGPSKKAAQLEGSKAFAKTFMQQHNIPTAKYTAFTAENFTAGVAYLHTHDLPIVLKADGLAAGKGVVICQSHLEAVAEFELMVQRSKFGEAGKKVVIEEFLQGIELSVFVLTDGKDYVLLPTAKDYKRIGEGDRGPNTGGMGAVSPVPFADAAFMKKVEEKIIKPTVEGLHKDRLDYKGFIFFGLIKVGDEPFVIEYNCRMGDPETEAVLPRINTDLVELLIATAEQRLSTTTIHIDDRCAATIVLASGGYPNEYKNGVPVTALPQNTDDVLLFHAGVRKKGEELLTAGGRVFCITALDKHLDEALHKAGDAAAAVQFADKYFRRDIGYEFVAD